MRCIPLGYLCMQNAPHPTPNVFIRTYEEGTRGGGGEREKNFESSRAIGTTGKLDEYALMHERENLSIR